MLQEANGLIQVKCLGVGESPEQAHASVRREHFDGDVITAFCRRSVGTSVDKG